MNAKREISREASAGRARRLAIARYLAAAACFNLNEKGFKRIRYKSVSIWLHSSFLMAPMTELSHLEEYNFVDPGFRNEKLSTNV